MTSSAVKPTIARCPNCKKPCKATYISGSFEWDPQSYHQVECEGLSFNDRCGYKGPKVIKEEEAIRLHNAICSSALLKELGELAHAWDNWADMHLDGEALVAVTRCFADVHALLRKHGGKAE